MRQSTSTVLITGVTDGIGRALAEHYGAAKAQVIGVGRRPSSPNELLTSGAYCQADLARPEAAGAISHFLDERRINRLDVLIHNREICPSQNESFAINSPWEKDNAKTAPAIL